MRGLEDRVGVRVVDRTGLILDIFGEHARSSEGKAQVELAQLAYELPRLRGHGREMSRIGGGRVAGRRRGHRRARTRRDAAGDTATPSAAAHAYAAGAGAPHRPPTGGDAPAPNA
ncbi:hypothetical protein [Streptomyces sp. NPDC093808]|uniref:hypothetical protein n=1 Tax=Streptomyces sp. NPDC093808 TaxID=3154985 RepID=UPI00344D7088